MNLSKSDKILIGVAVLICVVIACLSPFIASGNPDGLEKTAFVDAGLSEDTAYEAVESPMSDYSFEPLGKIGEIGALVLGIVVVLVLGFGVGYILKKRD